MHAAAAGFPVPGFHAPRAARRYLALGLAYFVAYFALNCITETRSLGGAAITLWSPDNALSVMLAMESWTFTPLVFAAQLFCDFWFGHVHSSAAGVVCAEATLAAGYLGMGMALRHGFGLDIRNLRPRDLVAVMAVTPLGATLTGLVYCGALTAAGDIDPQRFLSVYAGFWIGDAAAMGILIPATGALFRVLAARPWRSVNLGYPVALFAVTLVFLALVIVISASSLPNRYLFNLTYLPILLIGLKFGYDAGALTLLFTQLCLLLTLQYFGVADREYGAYQVMMFILAVSGLALGAAVAEWEATRSQLRRHQAELAKVSERATNGVIAASMSHEISQPLAAIAAYVVSARRLLEGGQGEERALSALRRAESEAARARAIVERLRDFVAKGALAHEPVDLRDLVDDILRLEADAARERGVSLRRAGADPGPLPAMIDRIGIEQAAVNLIVNAIEAVPQGTGEVTVTLERREGAARLSVADNGPGVADEIAGRLFEPFETTKPRGMGLGLPLAREIVIRHRGRLEWRRLAPQGACFELELPLA